MVGSMIALFLLCLSVCGLSALLNRRMEECWPVCFCAGTLWLYGFYCLGIVRLGLVLLCAGMVLLFIAGWRKKGSLGKLLLGFCTPGNLVYLSFCLLFWILFSGNIVSRNDEFRLWGAVPKAIHATGKLQLGTDSLIFSTMQSYPPGLPLMGYYFTAFSKEFSDGALFVGNACMALSFLAPAFSGWEWKHWRLLAPAALLVLLTPFVLTSHLEDMAMFGMTLFVDPMLGLAVGYGFYLAGRRPGREGFLLTAFTLNIGILCLLKDTGLLFALVILVTALVLDGENRKKYLLPLGALALSALSWKLLLKLCDVHALVPLKLHLLGWETMGNILRGLVSVNVLGYKLPLGFFLSFAFVFLMLLGLYVITAFRKEQDRTAAVAVAGGIVLSTAAFVYGYALLYGDTLESFARYMETPLLALSGCILLTALPNLPESRLMKWGMERSKGFAAALLIVCLLAGCGFTAAWRYVFPLYYQVPLADVDAAEIRACVERDMAPGETGRIYLVMAGDGWENSFYHNRIFYDLISSDINIRNGLAQTQVVIPGVENPGEIWAQELKDGYDYVYLLSVEDAFIPVFAEFSQDAPQPHGLYRVVPSQDGYGICLIRVNEGTSD